jgi:hypothetical protein
VPDPLLGDEQLVGEWDADAGLLVVTGWVAGPAGSAVVELPGAELDLDVAAPGRTCQLLVPVGKTGDTATVPQATRAVLHRLLGDPRAVALLNLIRGHSARPVVLPPPHEGPAAPVSPGPAPDHGGRGRLPLPVGGAGVDPRLARLGLARLGVADEELPPAARAVAQLEAAVTAADLPADLGLAPVVAAGTRDGAEALLTLVPAARRDPDVIAGRLGWLDPVTALRLAALTRRAANLPGTDPATATALGRLAAGLDLVPSAGALEPAPTAAATAGGAQETSGPLAGQAVSDRPAPELDAASARRVLPADARPAVARQSEHEIEVSVPGLGDALEGVWARVLRRADGLLLALAPFRAAGPDRADARARLLVPGESSAALLVDLTVDPAVPAPSAALRAFEQALAAGRRAARAQRLGRRGTAIAGWRHCAEAWTAAGDDRRAAMATEYAELVLAQAVPPTTEPLVSDRLA